MLSELTISWSRIQNLSKTLQQMSPRYSLNLQNRNDLLIPALFLPPVNIEKPSTPPSYVLWLIRTLLVAGGHPACIRFDRWQHSLLFDHLSELNGAALSVTLELWGVERLTLAPVSKMLFTGRENEMVLITIWYL